jgi:hypothetical protein
MRSARKVLPPLRKPCGRCGTVCFAGSRLTKPICIDCCKSCQRNRGLCSAHAKRELFGLCGFRVIN